MKTINFLFLFLSLILLGGCGKEESKQSSARVISEAFTLEVIQEDGGDASLIKLGTTKQLLAIARFSASRTEDITEISRWSSSNNNVVSVNNTGLIVAHSVGSASLRILQTGAEPVTIEVSVVSEPIESIEIKSSEKEVSIGTTLKLDLSGRFKNGDIEDISSSAIWESENELTVYIDEKGLVTAIRAGFVRINAYYVDLTNQEKITTSFDLIVRDAPISLQVTPEFLKTSINVPVNYEVYGIFDDNSKQQVTKNVSWVLDPNMQENSDGSLIALREGNYQVKAKLGGLSVSATLSASDKELANYSIQPKETTLSVGLKQNLKLMANFSDGSSQDVSSSALWTSSNAPVASISKEGVIQGNAVGNVVITAAYNGEELTSKVEVNRLELIDISAQIGSKSFNIGAEQALVIQAFYDDDS
jgi:hypothetical protein